MDWKDPDGLLPEASPCHVVPERIVIGIIMDMGKVMGRKNSTGSRHRQEHRVEESGTTIDASIIEAGLWRRQYTGITQVESLSREAIDRWLYYSCCNSLHMGVLCQVKSTVDIYYLQKPCEAGTDNSNPSYLWKLPIHCYFGWCFSFKLKLVFIIRMGDFKYV